MLQMKKKRKRSDGNPPTITKNWETTRKKVRCNYCLEHRLRPFFLKKAKTSHICLCYFKFILIILLLKLIHEHWWICQNDIHYLLGYLTNTFVCFFTLLQELLFKFNGISLMWTRKSKLKYKLAVQNHHFWSYCFHWFALKKKLGSPSYLFPYHTSMFMHEKKSTCVASGRSGGVR